MEEDTNFPSTPKQKQKLYTENREEKVGKHAFSHPFTLAALLEREEKDAVGDEDKNEVE